MSGFAPHVDARIDAMFDDWNDDAERIAAETLAASQPAASIAVVQILPIPAAAISGEHPQCPAKPLQPAPIPFQGNLGHYPALTSRSGLFAVARLDRDHASAMSGVMAQGAYEIEHQGPRLTMFDKSVWEIIVDLAKESAIDMNENFRVSLSDIARRMGGTSTGSRVLESIWDSLVRLTQSRVTCQLPKGRQGSGKMIASANKDIDGVSICLDAGLAGPILGEDLQFRIDTQRRRKLDSAFAQWLHDFLSTHNAGMSFTLGYLRDLSGYTANKRRFPESLIAALNQLAAIAPGLVVAYRIDRNGRNSGMWSVEIDRGPEAPAFVGFNRSDFFGSAKASAKKQKTKRSGVAL